MYMLKKKKTIIKKPFLHINMHSMVYDVSELLAAPDVLLYPIHTKA